MLSLENCVIENGAFRLSANLTVDTGQKIAIIGPSGAGKSTLASAIAGFLPISGSVTWDKADISALPPGKRPIAMLFQDSNLFPHLDIASNVGLGVRPDLRLDMAQREMVEQALERVGLSGLSHRAPSELSGGQQSRAALARVLVQNRALLILDEPFAALGPALKSEMLGLVDELAADTGATVLMVSHHPQDARSFADAVILVEGGQAHPPQPTSEIFDNPPPALRAYLGDRKPG